MRSNNRGEHNGGEGGELQREKKKEEEKYLKGREKNLGKEGEGENKKVKS